MSNSSGPAKNSANPGSDAASIHPEMEATFVGQDLTPDVLDDVGAEFVGSRQDNNLAFAVAMLRGGYANERTLTANITNWTAFGNATLSEHLVTVEMLTQAEADKIQSKATLLLRGISDRSLLGGNLSHSQRERAWLSQLDPSGRIGKLLGIADVSMLAKDESQSRMVGARYTLLRKLGQGGLGIVWLARDENLERYVAVKEIARDVASGDVALEHFRREAQITGRLEHPGIVPIYQFGDDAETGKSFYVMRFLGKRTLQDALTEYHERLVAGNQDPMMFHRLLTAFVNVCHSVGHAHSRKVIHRDLKPENIALDEFGQVTLLDWGLAKINDETGMYDLNGRTEPGDLHGVGSLNVGRVLGTPFYMAPEQAAGRLDEVDELTDVFGLGGILYAILTGFAPHQATCEAQGSGAKASVLLSSIVSDSVTRPEEIQPHVSPDLSAVCMKALSNKRYLRYGSATDLAEEVQRHIAGTPVAAYQAPFKQRLMQWMSAHPTLTQGVLLLTSLLLIGGGAIAYTAGQGRSALQQARYASVKEFSREVEVNLQFETQGLVRDLHFIAELPLMRVISQSFAEPQERHSDSGAGKSREEAKPPESVSSAPSGEGMKLLGRDGALLVSDVTASSPEEWLNRVGNLYDGLLSANPAYLVMSTCQSHPDGSLSGLVQSTRLSVGKRAHRTPQKQLVHVDPAEENSTESRMIQSIRPGQAMLVTNDQLSENVPTQNRSPLVMSGVTPIFGVDGEFFGLSIIELDLRQRLKELFLAVAPEHVSVCVTDIHGNIVIRYHDGQFDEIDGRESIIDEFSPLRSFFAPEATALEAGDGKTFYAHRVRLGDSSSRAYLGIVAHIHESL